MDDAILEGMDLQSHLAGHFLHRRIPRTRVGLVIPVEVKSSRPGRADHLGHLSFVLATAEDQLAASYFDIALQRRQAFEHESHDGCTAI